MPAANHDVLTTVIASVSALLGSFLVYRAQIYIANRKNGKQKTQQEVAVDTMVNAYDQALANKDMVIKGQAETIKQQAEEILALRK